MQAIVPFSGDPPTGQHTWKRSTTSAIWSCSWLTSSATRRDTSDQLDLLGEPAAAGADRSRSSFAASLARLAASSRSCAGPAQACAPQLVLGMDNAAGRRAAQAYPGPSQSLAWEPPQR